jgi:cation transport ATPase
MNEMSGTSSSTTTSLVLMIVFVTLALSLVALIFASTILDQNTEAGSILLVLGFLGVALSTYVLFQTRRRLSRLRVEVPPVTTTTECKKCGYKNVREFQRGDYIFKELDQCQKCNDKLIITAIYREVKEKEKERFRF